MWEAIDQCSALIVITAWQENTICSIVCMMECYVVIICLSYHFKYMKKKSRFSFSLPIKSKLSVDFS